VIIKNAMLGGDIRQHCRKDEAQKGGDFPEKKLPRPAFFGSL
jgi:hypothetical protein